MDVEKRDESWGERTSGDLSSLLVELSRALKGLRFYDDRHPARRDLLDRAFLAWRVDLDRAGPLELLTDTTGFRAEGVLDAVPHGHLADLAELLLEQDVGRLVIGEDITRGAFHAFLGLLSLSDRELKRRGGFANALAEASVAGITVNRTEEAPAEPAPEPEPEAVPQPTAVEKPCDSATPELDAPADLVDTLAAGRDEDGTSASLGSALLCPPTASEDAAPFHDLTKPTLEERPLEAPVGDAAEAGLRSLLRELDFCTDENGYSDIARAVLDEARRLGAEGRAVAAYRAVLVLADQAVGNGARSEEQMRVAQVTLEELTTGPLLEDLMDRACDPEGGVAVRAAQVLLQLGGRAVAPLLDRLESETNRSRSAQIGAIVIALGERAVPILVAAIRGSDPARVATAVRLSGELQSTNLVPTLKAVLGEGPSDLRREAAGALVQIGTEPALAALVDALSSPRTGVAELAAGSLGAAGDARAQRPLMEHLDHAVADRRYGLACALVRALGEMGGEDVVPKLVALLERRSWLRRSETRELKIAAIEALGSLPGREARRAIGRISRGRGDAKLQDRARRVLERLESQRGSPHPG